MSEFRVVRAANKLHFQGTFTLQDLHRPLAAIHHAVETAGYSDVVLDFSGCTAAFPAAMLGLCAQVVKLQRARVDISLILPEEGQLKRLFVNANWAQFISPRDYPPSAFRGYTQVPATQYRTSDEQARAVNRIVNAILGAIPEINREDFAALEWAINELTDNVLVHAQSSVGGFVQVSTFKRNAKRVAFIVADAGIGIPKSLKSGRPEIADDVDALDKAIREGVTRDPSVGQGNGLFGSYEICSHSNGRFQVDSGYAKLYFDEKTGLHVKAERIPYEGTLVAAEIDFSEPLLLAEALRFGGKRHSPLDFVETHYEDPKADLVRLKIVNETASFGSRVAGTPLRVKLINLSKMCPSQKVIIDFSDVALVSSSFADEVVGKLFAELGPMTFMQRFQVLGATRTVQALIDKAVSQRLASTK